MKPRFSAISGRLPASPGDKAGDKAGDKRRQERQGDLNMTDTTDVTEATPKPSLDLLYGAHAIAEYLNITVRQAEHLIETGRIPIFKIGRTVAARRSKLNAALEALEAGPPED
jgi:excisionase family DNA binding protein